MHSSPAVSPDGATVFVGSEDRKVYALNAATGQQRWAFETGLMVYQYISRGWVRSSPAVSADGATVFVGAGDTNLYALNAATGEKRWASALGVSLDSSPALSPDGATVFVGGGIWDNKTYALNAATGEQRWAVETGLGMQSSPAVSPDGATVFVGSWAQLAWPTYGSSHHVYALNAATGEQRWGFMTGPCGVISSPAVSADGETVFVVTETCGDDADHAEVFALFANACGPGSSRANGRECVPCGAGKYVSPGTRECKECPINSELLTDRTGCTANPWKNMSFSEAPVLISAVWNLITAVVLGVWLL